MKKYIVFENWAFGRNYYNQAGQCCPDYTIRGELPTMTKAQAENIAGRMRCAQIAEI